MDLVVKVIISLFSIIYRSVIEVVVVQSILIISQVYPAGVHPKFPEGGKLTQHLDRLQLGDTIDVRGPSGKLVYEGLGAFRIRDEKDRVGPGKQVRAKQVTEESGVQYAAT